MRAVVFFAALAACGDDPTTSTAGTDTDLPVDTDPTVPPIVPVMTVTVLALSRSRVLLLPLE